ncbi:MAG: hypothetical protein DMG39_16620 [Acidobacteria bacterium]|nr:MAG: hypothetical protein DMG39_16620 [Acidobacteriota bacterium]
MNKQEQHNYSLLRDDLKALGGQLKSWGQAWGLKVKTTPAELHGEGLQIWKGHQLLRLTICSPKEMGPEAERDSAWGIKIQEALTGAEERLGRWPGGWCRYDDANHRWEETQVWQFAESVVRRFLNLGDQAKSAIA